MSTDKVLHVDGASLFYRSSGNGPVLFLLAGGDGDADTFTATVSRLQSHFTVVTYDRRGLSRSKLDDGCDPAITIERHADDAANVLAVITDEPGIVFGGSLGAVIGLALTAQYLLCRLQPGLRIGDIRSPRLRFTGCSRSVRSRAL